MRVRRWNAMVTNATVRNSTGGIMVRQHQLERAGWTFVRVRESDGYANQQEAIKAALEACEQLGIRPVDFLAEARHQSSAALAPDSNSQTSFVEGTVVARGAGERGTGETDVASSPVGPFTGYSETSDFPDPRGRAHSKGSERPPPDHRARWTADTGVRVPAVRRGLSRAAASRENRTAGFQQSPGAVLRAGEIVQKDELGDGSPEGQLLRVAGTPKVRVKPAGRRDFLEIPPAELRTVLKELRCGD